MISGININMSDLQQQLTEKDRYVSELEASLSPVKPKKPFILTKPIEDK
jgi:hypothetical protein